MPFGVGRMVARAKKKQAAEAKGEVREVTLRSGEKVDYVPSMLSPTGTGGYVRRRKLPVSELGPRPVPRHPGQPNRLGFWHNRSVGKANVRGFEGKPPSRALGWTWTLHSQRPEAQVFVEPPPILIPHERPIRPRNGAIFKPPTPRVIPKAPPATPPEIAELERQPDTPPPAGFDVAALFDTVLTAFRGAQQPSEVAPAAQPRPFAAAYRPPQVSEEGPVAAAGFNIQQLLIPALVVGGLFAARKFL